MGPAIGPVGTMCKTRVTPPPPAPRQAEVVDTTIDQSQLFLHISVNQHVALMATTVGLVSVLLLCLALYCIKPYITRCLRNLVSQEEDLSAARNSAGAFPEGSYALNTVSRARGPLGSDTQSRPYSTPSTALYITNQSEENHSGGSREHSPDAEKTTRRGKKYKKYNNTN